MTDLALPDVDVRIDHELRVLFAEFAYRLDILKGEALHELFAEDGVYTIDGESLTGRETIAARFAARAARGPRTARHLFTNVRIESLGEDRASATAAMVLYAADGTPVLPATPPLIVADVTDELVRTAEGWRFARRELTSVFRGTAEIVTPMSVGASEDVAR